MADKFEEAIEARIAELDEPILFLLAKKENIFEGKYKPAETLGKDFTLQIIDAQLRPMQLVVNELQAILKKARES